MSDAKEPIRFGLIGAGEVADSWLAPALRNVKGARLQCVASRTIDKAVAFAKKHGASGGVVAYDNFDLMLADPEVDAVIIATPDGLHARQAIAAARARKHVFVEKPMATSLGDARRMVNACEEADVRLGVGFHNRWHEGHRIVASYMKKGWLGDVRHISLRWASSPAKDASNWRASSDVGRWWSMAALGSHCLDLARWMMAPVCGGVVSIRAITSDVAFKSGRDESANISLQFENGATADIYVSIFGPRQKRVEIFGSENTIVMNDTLGASGAGTIIYDGAKGHFPVVNPYECELADFVAAIREGREPEASGMEGKRNVALLCLAEDDAKRK
jgi:1,5-anhydro-D-fructose reductase (1,5-anhydro-D-mannitol-forming)